MSVNGDDSTSSSTTSRSNDYSSPVASTPDSNRSSEERRWNNDGLAAASEILNIESSDSSGEPIEMHKRSYSKWCPVKQGATLVWRDVCVYANDVRQQRGAGQLKRIINNSTGAIQPGTLMALMGSR